MTESIEMEEEYEYKERLIAFIDVLGFKELIKEQKADILIKTIELIKKEVESKPYMMEQEDYSMFLAGPGDEESSERLYGSREISMFSDLAVISYGLKEEKNCLSNLHKLLHTIYFMQEHLTNNSILIRGGITCGQLYHKGEICVGPGLIKAYELESKEAIYPRVIVDPELLNDRRFNKILGRWPDYLEQYKDDYYFITHFKPLRTHFDIFPEEDLERKIKTWRVYIIQVMYAYKVAIERALNSDIVKVQAKGRWLEEQYNEVLDYFQTFYDYSDEELGYIVIKKENE